MTFPSKNLLCMDYYTDQIKIIHVKEKQIRDKIVEQFFCFVKTPSFPQECE